MAVPLQYQSQFIPTDFGAVSNVLGMYRQDMNQREQQFDQAQAGANTALANIYGIETLDPELFQQAGDTLSQKIDEVVSKRGGDYGAAAQDISRLIAQETKNPIYGLNKRKLEQTKLLEHALARNPNLRVLKNPRTMGLSSNMTMEDITYEVADPANVQKVLEDVWGNLKNRVTQGTPRQSKAIPWAYEYLTTKGLTSDQIEEMLQDPATFETVIARMPQLEKYKDDPATMQWLQSQVSEGLRAFEGSQVTNYMNIPASLLQGNQQGGGQESGLAYMQRGLAPTLSSFESPKDVHKNYEVGTPQHVQAQQIKQKAINELTSEDNPNRERNIQLINKFGGNEEAIDKIYNLSDYGTVLPSLKQAAEPNVEFLSNVLNVVVPAAKLAMKQSTQLNFAYNTIKKALGFPTYKREEAINNLHQDLNKAKKDLSEGPIPGIQTLASPVVGGILSTALKDYNTKKKEAYKDAGIDKLNREERSRFFDDIYRVTADIENTEQNIIHQDHGDIPTEFISPDLSTKVGQETRKYWDNLVDSRQIKFDNFNIFATSGDDAIKNLERLKKKGTKEYANAQETFSIKGAIPMEGFGVIYEIETQNEDKVIETHFATSDNDNINKAILKGPSIEGTYPVASVLLPQYELQKVVEKIKGKYGNNLKNLPKYKEFEGETLGEYLDFISVHPNLTVAEKKNLLVEVELLINNAEDSVKIK